MYRAVALAVSVGLLMLANYASLSTSCAQNKLLQGPGPGHWGKHGKALTSQLAVGGADVEFSGRGA